MNKFEENRKHLDVLTERLKNEGMSKDLENKFEKLYSETRIAILLGPNDSIKRSGETEAREYADAKDLWYYNDTFLNIDYKAFLKDESLGEVELEYFIRIIQGKEIPVLRISYEKKGFYLTHYLMKKRKRLLIKKSNICL